ncbi:hypothetical protein A8709_09270 [Paenibacillus pectinilyticus]|uniref:Uncharacterized protein n=1 Tax=Paenibacillus pectinilyticus TaxID=512399 RepID=A0A1C1A5J4_9BACL|nr:hypothetical protein [Paenibacillus pectinilyticus]OCT15809.1 hypothetical protein A8709_09270 [Paenibacillus pectinilyticus]
MTIAALEKCQTELTTNYEGFVKRKIQEGKLHDLFKFQMQVIHQITNWKDESEKIDIIDHIITIFKEACQELVICQNCAQPFNFRHCKNPSETEQGYRHVIELSCNDCGDYFTIAEGREVVTHFNWNVLGIVENLRRRSRGFTIKYTLANLGNPALINIPNNGGRPVVWIDGNQVLRKEDALKYWERAKSFLKGGKKQTDIPELQWYETEEAKVFIM